MTPVDVVLGALVVSDALLAALAFTLWGRPERMLGLLCSMTGHADAWHAGVLAAADEERLLGFAARLRLPALVAVFLWSGALGATLAGLGRLAVVIPGG